jgi:hypothetical protein
MTRNIRLLGGGSPPAVLLFHYERVVVIPGRVRCERPERHRVIAIVPEISIIKEDIFVRKVVALMDVFGIYVDRARRSPWMSVINIIPKDVKVRIQDGVICKQSTLIRCARHKGGT